ncbi:restriction endonuclease subunit R [Microbacterium sp. PRF11]|uniref:restriction endonuclease subunit R n=1 Tax=Microbacterium sp. PRF11 TaxID=2962593 RepID=UPI002882B769|nr:restriction endonuclease subunit R [Microbacterium sp. PRF11]MDT0118330.1 restriction endonuclease subunit R [Microbacterium sp. PRF11]
MSVTDGWTLSASAFNLTPAVIRAERTAPDLALTLVDRGIASAIEIELGQMWRGFPAPPTREVEAFRDRLATAGGRVSIVGVSIDEYDRGRRRTDAERRAFLEPQLRAAASVGAAGVRLPIGQAGAILDDLVPLLEELDLVLYEEAQGHETPAARPAAYDRIADLDTPHVRLLLDISMLMPALPVTYLQRLERGGIPGDLVGRLREEWRDPATHDAVVDLLRTGRVPGPVHTLYMNLLVRFGRSRVQDLASVLPLLGGIHLKFWDLDDADHRLSDPLRDVGAALAATGFTGTLCSEWGGQEWLDDDPWEMTSRHLALAAGILSDRPLPAPLQKESTR